MAQYANQSQYAEENKFFHTHIIPLQSKLTAAWESYPKLEDVARQLGELGEMAARFAKQILAEKGDSKP